MKVKNSFQNVRFFNRFCGVIAIHLFYAMKETRHLQTKSCALVILHIHLLHYELRNHSRHMKTNQSSEL